MRPLPRLSALLAILAATAAAAQPFDGGALSLDGGFAISARLSIDPIDFVPYPLSNGNGMASSVIGSAGLVVWKDNRDYQDMLYATRIDAQGRVLDPGGIRLIRSISQGWGVVPFGGNHLIFFPSTSSPYRLLAHRVSAQGVLLDASPLEVVSSMGLDYPVGAACTPQTCLFAWSGFDGLKTARLSAQGVALDPMGVTVSSVSSSNGSTQTWVATDGTDFLVSTRLPFLPDGGPSATTVTTARVLASTGQSTGVRAPPLGTVYAASLAGSPSGYVLAGKTAFNGPFVVMRLDPSGAVIDSPPISIPNSSSDYHPRLVFSGSAYQAIWRELPAGGSAFKSVAIPPSGAVGALQATTLFSSTSVNPYDYLHHASSAAAGFWLAIAHATPTPTENVPTLHRFDATGAPRDGAGVPLRLLPSTQQRPSVAWGSGCYLAVWEDNAGNSLSREIYARRFDAAGQPLDAAPFRIAAAPSAQRTPKVAFDGQNFLAVWTEGPFNGQYIRGARISPAGAVLDAAGIRISPMAVNATDGRLAFTSGVYGVLWKEITGDHLRFQRLSPAGQVLDAAPIDVRVHFATQSTPELFANGSGFLALWLDSELSGAQVFGARITPQGAVQDMPPINVSARPPGGFNVQDHRPSAVFGAQEWLVVYNTETSKEVATRLSPTGQVLEARRPLSFPGASDYSPSVTAFDGQRFRYLWAKSTPPATVRFGSWDTSTDAGPPPAGAWAERVDELAWAQAASDSALLLTEGPYLQDLPFLPRVSRRLARFCPPGAACPAPVLFEDGGRADAGMTIDAGAPDSGVPVDTGTSTDAGPGDAGSVDSGAPDAGAEPDAGVLPSDAGSTADAGMDDPAQLTGCGCGASGLSSETFAFALLVLALLRRHRALAP